VADALLEELKAKYEAGKPSLLDEMTAKYQPEESPEEDFDADYVPTTSRGPFKWTEEYDQSINIPFGYGETAATFATGIASAIGGGVWAVGEEAYRVVHGEFNQLDKMVDRIHSTVEAFTYMPKTATGQVILDGATMPFVELDEKMSALGEWVTEKTGSPAMGTAAYMSLDIFLTFLKTNPGKAAKIRLEARELQKKADEFGIDLKATKEVQAEQVGAVAEKMAAGAGRGDSSAQIVRALEKARKAGDEVVDNLYERARREGEHTAIEPDYLNNTLKPMIKNGLEDFMDDMADLPKTRARYSEIMDIIEESTPKPVPTGSRTPASYSILTPLPPRLVPATINKLEAWRKRINKLRAKTNDPADAAGLGILKGQYDRFIENQFISDMISGNPEAIKAWKTARAARAELGRLFDDNAIISKLINEKLTSEQVRSFIFGASEAGFANQVGATVRAIKNVIGAKSDALKALQNDAMLNILDPLLGDPPNLKMFAKRYNDVVRKNKTVMKELFDNQELKALSTFASAIHKHAGDEVKVLGSISTFVARMTAGHGIAKGQARVGIVKGTLDLMTKSTGATSRRKILMEIIGHDPNVPLFPIQAPIRGAVLEAGTPEPNG